MIPLARMWSPMREAEQVAKPAEGIRALPVFVMWEGNPLKKFVVSAILAGLLSFSFLAVAAQSTTVNVTPGDMKGWGFLQETPTGSGSLVNGPSNPPLGTGSANLQVDSTGGVIIGKADYQGTRLVDITKLEYSTYRTSGGPALAIALQFNIDFDLMDSVNTYQGRMVYEPYHTKTVEDLKWQTWNPMDNDSDGNWWFTNAIGAAECPHGDPCTWQEVLDAFPKAGIHSDFGAVILKAGGGWTGGFDGNVDALTIGVNGADTTYNFEAVPTSMDDCKNGGWEAFGFKNQGQCIKFVNTGK